MRPGFCSLFRWACACLVAAWVAAPRCCAAELQPRAAELQPIERTFMQGRVDDAVAAIQSLPEAGRRSGPAQLLLCRAYLSEDSIDPAIPACEAAARAMPADSAAQDWLGRAYGRKAEHAGPLAGFSLARKVRDAFEAAVRLDDRNGDAADDLGEFYVEAPAIVGGGLAKADALAHQIEGSLPERAQLLRARIAEKNKDFETAEREFRASAELASGRPDGWVDLGSYYARQHQAERAEQALRHAIAIDRTRDANLAHAAEVLLDLGRAAAPAIGALRSYLAGPALSDAAPACKAYTTLARLLKASGDPAAAKMELQRSLGLAHGYLPARKELAGL